MNRLLQLINSFLIGGSESWDKTHIWGKNVIGASACRFALDTNRTWVRKKKRGEMPTCKVCRKLVKVFEIDGLKWLKQNP